VSFITILFSAHVLSVQRALGLLVWTVVVRSIWRRGRRTRMDRELSADSIPSEPITACVFSSRLRATTQTHGLCLRPDQTHGQSPYMSRLSERVYDQTKSADLSGTQAVRVWSGWVRVVEFRNDTTRPNQRRSLHGRACLVEFGHEPTHYMAITYKSNAVATLPPVCMAEYCDVC